MRRVRSFLCDLGIMAYTLQVVVCDAVRFLMLCLRPSPTLAAENLILRRELAQYQERQVKPRRANDATRITLVWLNPTWGQERSANELLLKRCIAGSAPYFAHSRE
jgi:hypothetical protein